MTGWSFSRGGGVKVVVLEQQVKVKGQEGKGLQEEEELLKERLAGSERQPHKGVWAVVCHQHITTCLQVGDPVIKQFDVEEAEQEGVEPVSTVPQLGQLGHSTLQAVQALGLQAWLSGGLNQSPR